MIKITDDESWKSYVVAGFESYERDLEKFVDKACHCRIDSRIAERLNGGFGSEYFIVTASSDELLIDADKVLFLWQVGFNDFEDLVLSYLGSESF